MDWNLFWTVIVQILLAIAILTFPLAISLLLLSAAVRRDLKRVAPQPRGFED